MAYANRPPPANARQTGDADAAKEALAFETLVRDLRRIFDQRLASVVAYGAYGVRDEDGAHTLALVEQLTFVDLAKCVPLASSWHRMGLATPLILTRDEFRRTLDVFPLEYGDIIAHHAVLTGPDPFKALAVPEADLRRGCEQQAKSHLIHLREGFLETGGNTNHIAQLIAASATAFQTLLMHLESLDPGVAGRAGITDELVREIESAADTTIADPSALLARYIAAVERLWQYVDAWR